MMLIFLEDIRDRTGCKVRVDTCLSLHVLSIANEYDAVAFTLAFLERKMRATDCYVHFYYELEEFSSLAHWLNDFRRRMLYYCSL